MIFRKPLSRSEKLITVSEWLNMKCQNIFTGRKVQHADDVPISEGWSLHEPLGGAQMVHHKSYRLSSLCRELTRNSGLSKEEVGAKILGQVVDGINYNVILLTGLIEDRLITIPELDKLICRGDDE